MTALATTEVSPLDLEEFYQGYLDQPYNGQDPVTLPPLLKSGLARFAERKRKSDRLRKATEVSAGVGGALMVAAPLLSLFGKKGASSGEATTDDTENSGPAPPSYEEHIVAQKEANGVSSSGSFSGKPLSFLSRVKGQEVASGLAAASAVLGGALLIGAVATLFSKWAARAKTEAERQRIRAVLLRRMEQMGAHGGGAEATAHWSVGGVGEATGPPADQVQDVAVESAAEVPPAAPDSSSPPPEVGAAPASKYGKRGIWIGLSDHRSDTPSELGDIQKFVELARETGNAAVFYPE